jgi:hypothetical protein
VANESILRRHPGADSGVLVHLAGAADVALLRRAVLVPRAHAHPLERAPGRVRRRRPPADAEHRVAPVAGEEAVGVVGVFDAQEVRQARVFARGADEGEVAILAPVRQAAVLEDAHLLDLLQHVFEQARPPGVAAAVVGDVEVHHISRRLPARRGLAQVRRGRLHVPHEDAVVELDAAQRLGLQVPQPAHLGDERRGTAQGKAEGGLVEEGAGRHPRVPGARRQQRVLGPRHAPTRRLHPVLRPHHRIPREQPAAPPLQPVAGHRQRRVGHPRRQALAAAVARALEEILGETAGLDHDRWGGAEADEVHGALAGRGQRQAVVDAVHRPPVPREPRDVGELMLVPEFGHLLRQVVVVPLRERHRALEQRLQRQRHLACTVLAPNQTYPDCECFNVCQIGRSGVCSWIKII